MKVLAALLFFGLCSLPLLAQVSDKYLACNKVAKTQSELNACASDEAARNDAELNREYRKLLSLAGKDRERLAKIESMERAWVAFRDAYLDAMYPANDKQAEYGSMFPMEFDMLRAKWEKFAPVFERWIPTPRVLHPYPDARFYATHPS